ncbi:hypothetical protein C0991_006971 [Blastosporella zonata]|nr:hypothetical protein C0991_006971 [Blastosporella zonata]
MGIRTVFTDHSLFGFEDAASILTNKLLVGTLKNVDAVICVSHTGRENTVLRGELFEIDLQDPNKLVVRENVYVIPNALVADEFKPGPPKPTDISELPLIHSPDARLRHRIVTIVVLSRLAYRKGIDLLVATAPRICATFPSITQGQGGDGPKLIDLLQMREKHLLQDRIELLGPVRHNDVQSVRSPHESFGIAILEAACTGLYVVSTRVGGVPEILPKDMISFAEPDEDGLLLNSLLPFYVNLSVTLDVVRAIAEAIAIVSTGKHDSQRAHERVKTFYNWEDVTERTEKVYDAVMKSPQMDLWERMQRTMQLGPFAGPIYTIILIVDCLFFLFLEWWMPREDLDYVKVHWNPKKFAQVHDDSLSCTVSGSDMDTM